MWLMLGMALLRDWPVTEVGYRPTTLLTSLIDPAKYPAAELRVLYHERWEIELG